MLWERSRIVVLTSRSAVYESTSMKIRDRIVEYSISQDFQVYEMIDDVQSVQ
jgi:hypothetical protein